MNNYICIIFQFITDYLIRFRWDLKKINNSSDLSPHFQRCLWTQHDISLFLFLKWGDAFTDVTGQTNEPDAEEGSGCPCL